MTGNAKNIAVLSILSLSFYIGIGNVHLFDWDEINFAECAREMITSGNWLYPQIKYTAFWEKPPLFIWMQAISMSIFGISEFSARLPNAVFGTLTILMLYFCGRKLKNEKFGLIWALVYASSLLPFIYFKSGIIDPVFNFFIFLSFYLFIYALSAQHKGYRLFILAGFINGLAILTKGPVGFLLPAVSLLILLIFRRSYVKQLLTFTISSAITGVSWYLLCIAVNGFSFFMQFIHYQSDLFSKPVAGHSEFLLYHFVIVFFGCFPMSVLAFREMTKIKFLKQDFFGLSMYVLFWVVMIVFTIVTTKIIHYSSLAYFPLSWFAAVFIYRIYKGEIVLQKLTGVIYLITGFLWAAVFFITALLPYLPAEQFFKDKYITEILQNTGGNALSFFPSFIFIFCVISASILMRKRKVFQALFVQFGGTAVSLLIVLYTILPLVETLSQGDLITGVEELQNRDIPCLTSGFKSYAPYFYGKIEPSETELTENSRPVCIITRITKPREDLEKAEESYIRGRYHFYVLK